MELDGIRFFLIKQKKKKRLKDTVLYNKKPIQNYPIRKNDEKKFTRGNQVSQVHPKPNTIRY